MALDSGSGSGGLNRALFCFRTPRGNVVTTSSKVYSFPAAVLTRTSCLIPGFRGCASTFTTASLRCISAPSRAGFATWLRMFLYVEATNRFAEGK